ncbi:hypothetical protein HMPREF9346_05272 [Escherichia coli MS 119-7]|nr:hypothetical protein HMPREF9346_05272 [Escherichia coli MS 119-7]
MNSGLLFSSDSVSIHVTLYASIYCQRALKSHICNVTNTVTVFSSCRG